MLPNINHQFLFLLTLTLFCVSLAGEDFYKLLGVDRGATVKEIRRAFKKIAISEHPDKKTDDPKAHDKFIKINRAYEVLKDEDLRKKYDQFGEEGLEDKGGFGGHGHRYESYHFYRHNFGIYDDDPEIVTLSRQDFETLIHGTKEPWFINFYSSHCHHCHELAPYWREMARELHGVINIGAVNCGDDIFLCRRENVRAYPTLLFYPDKREYMGGHDTEELVQVALNHVKAIQYDLSMSKFKRHVEGQVNNLPWLITYCGDGADCLEHRTTLKLAAMMADLVNVGVVQCEKDPEICEKVARNGGTYFYTSGNVRKGAGKTLPSLDPREIYQDVLGWLPDMETLDEEKFQDVIDNRDEQNWLVHFVQFSGEVDLELRKLPGLLKDDKIGRVDCQQLSEICHNLDITKYPTFILFKRSGKMERYYGDRLTANSLQAFVMESASAPMENLGPEDFPTRVISSGDPWFVDFFAPWCPPCMRLLPEFRKASKFFGSTVNFGTVDCTVHVSLCNQYNINSYPTTIFYNQSKPFQFKGQHTAQELLEFVEDTLRPPVIVLDDESYPKRVHNKGTNEIWLIDFFAPWCGPCMRLAPEWRRLAKEVMKKKKDVFVASVDCQAYGKLCRNEGVGSYPTIRLYPAGTDSSFFKYSGWNRDAASIRNWAYEYLPSKVMTLKTNIFKPMVLQSSEPWLVYFYAPWCGHCQLFRPVFDEVAESLAGKAFCGKVDCDRQPDICDRAMIQAYPTVYFYKGTTSTSQGYQGVRIRSQNHDDLIKFVMSKLPRDKQIKQDEHLRDEL